MANQVIELLDHFIDELQDATMMSLVQREFEVPFSREAKHARLDARLRMALPIGDDVELAIEVLKAGYHMLKFAVQLI